MLFVYNIGGTLCAQLLLRFIPLFLKLCMLLVDINCLGLNSQMKFCDFFLFCIVSQLHDSSYIK